MPNKFNRKKIKINLSNFSKNDPTLSSDTRKHSHKQIKFNLFSSANFGTKLLKLVHLNKIQVFSPRKWTTQVTKKRKEN